MATTKKTAKKTAKKLIDPDFGEMPFTLPGGEIGKHRPLTKENLAEVLEQNARRRAATKLRELILDPNKDSDIKIEIYSCPAPIYTLEARKEEHFSVSWRSAVTIRAQRLTINVDRPGVLYVKAIRLANVNASVGVPQIAMDGSSVDERCWQDAFSFSPLANQKEFDLPTMSPANTFTVEYFYTGRRFAKNETSWILTTEFRGPATLCG
jgi:hypothetical protein